MPSNTRRMGACAAGAHAAAPALPAVVPHSSLFPSPSLPLPSLMGRSRSCPLTRLAGLVCGATELIHNGVGNCGAGGGVSRGARGKPGVLTRGFGFAGPDLQVWAGGGRRRHGPRHIRTPPPSLLPLPHHASPPGPPPHTLLPCPHSRSPHERLPPPCIPFPPSSSPPALLTRGRRAHHAADHEARGGVHHAWGEEGGEGREGQQVRQSVCVCVCACVCARVPVCWTGQAERLFYLVLFHPSTAPSSMHKALLS